ncbi:hypothetical protein HLA87_00275 [Mycoplasma miroungigenitalium]|uniref:Uncharacterized protein n=1 Tax=Mycoplasma miroungigenitalium TaxID=754515 RepID=A0A6M4JB02_9MOLU|nr:hypothetical protein [Mycoplasma miroungigenitalium]QJR43249.1 hypothetical protein HLA87_00275 [Mycoplasma miroungigenitalium]
MNELEKAKKIAIPLLVLQIVAVILGIIAYSLVIKLATDTQPSTNESNNLDVAHQSVSLIFLQLLLCGSGIAGVVLQIILAVKASKFDQTIMILLIVGFFVPIVSLVGVIMVLTKKYVVKPINNNNVNNESKQDNPVFELDKTNL